jgi:hypothetical protein
MDKIPNRTNMIRQRFGERQGFAHQTRTALTKGIVKTFDGGGFARVFADRSMALGGENRGIRLPKIGVADGTLAVDGRQGIPQALRACFIPWSDITTDNQAVLRVYR